MKNIIENRIKEIRAEMFSISHSIDELSNNQKRKDLCSPNESVWRQLNSLYGEIKGLQWVLNMSYLKGRDL